MATFAETYPRLAQPDQLKLVQKARQRLETALHNDPEEAAKPDTLEATAAVNYYLALLRPNVSSTREQQSMAYEKEVDLLMHWCDNRGLIP